MKLSEWIDFPNLPERAMMGSLIVFGMGVFTGSGFISLVGAFLVALVLYAPVVRFLWGNRSRVGALPGVRAGGVTRRLGARRRRSGG